VGEYSPDASQRYSNSKQEWEHQLRSSLHPALFAGLYYVANKSMLMLGLLPSIRATILGLVPTLAQAVIAATGDYYTWKLSSKIYGTKINAAWATVSQKSQ